MTTSDYSHRHLRLGWWWLLVFAGLGLILETLHGFKVGAYLNVSNETRRLMWRLAHAHGTLLGAVNILFALTLRTVSDSTFRDLRTISRLLVGASILLPLGFFLGGVQFYGGDPGLGVLVVPVAAVLLLAALFMIASGLRVNSSAVKERAQKQVISRSLAVDNGFDGEQDPRWTSVQQLRLKPGARMWDRCARITGG